MPPYRDFFDNHMPLFHIVSAPIFRWFGVRPDIVVPMRLLINGLFALNLWCVWKLASQFFSRADCPTRPAPARFPKYQAISDTTLPIKEHSATMKRNGSKMRNNVMSEKSRPTPMRTRTGPQARARPLNSQKNLKPVRMKVKHPRLVNTNPRQ
jgi:hypothetical protein